MNLKNTITQIAYEIGFNQCKIASLDDLDYAAKHLKNWLDLGYAGQMTYLHNNNEVRTKPKQLFKGAKSAILLSANYYSIPNPRPDGFWGKIATYAVGLDYHKVLPQKANLLIAQLKKYIDDFNVIKCVTDSTPLYEVPLSQRHGIGFKGKNTLIIGPKMLGSYNFLLEIFTDLELEPDLQYKGTCGKCFRCGDICPTKAIIENVGINANLCISYLTIENKDIIPQDLRPKLKNLVYGCDICQEICPYNSQIEQTKMPEFMPQSGFGHYLDLEQLLSLKSNRQYLKLFQNTSIKRAKLKAMQRNSLVVLGNILNNIDNNLYINPKYDNQSKLIQLLSTYIENSQDPILLEHAIWALNQDSKGTKQLNNLYGKFKNQTNKSIFEKYL